MRLRASAAEKPADDTLLNSCNPSADGVCECEHTGGECERDSIDPLSYGVCMNPAGVEQEWVEERFRACLRAMRVAFFLSRARKILRAKSILRKHR